MRTKRLKQICVVGISGLLLISVNGNAQFQAMEEVADPNPSGKDDLYTYSIDMAVDNDGCLHVCYSQKEFDRAEDDQWYYNWYLYYTNNCTGIFTSPALVYSCNLREGMGGIWSLSMDADADNHLHIAFIDVPGAASQGEVMYFTNKTGSWSNPVPIGKKAFGCASLVTGSNNYVHIAYYPGGEWPDTSLGYSFNQPAVSDSWTHEGIVRILSYGEMADLDIALDRFNQPFVSYWDRPPDQGGKIMYNYRILGNWQPGHLIVNETGWGAMSSIAVGPEDQIHISYYDDNKKEIVYANRLLSTSFTMQTIETSNTWLPNKIAVNAFEKAFIAYNASNGSLHLAENTTGSWMETTLASWQESPGVVVDIEIDIHDYCHIVCFGKKIMYITNKSQTFEDEDNDNILNSIEKGSDHSDENYDGNNDGKADWQQANVASFDVLTGDYVTLACPEGQKLIDVKSLPGYAVSDVPFNVNFPYECFDFKVIGMGLGGNTQVTLYLADCDKLTSYWKYGPTLENHSKHWYEFTGSEIHNTGYKIFEDKIELYLKDGLYSDEGQTGDDDWTANDTIEEPGAPVRMLIPGIYISETEIYLDTLEPGESQHNTLFIHSIGEGQLIIDSIFLATNDEFDFMYGFTQPDIEFPDTLDVADSLALCYSFVPQQIGDKQATLLVYSSDPENPLEEIELYGTCSVPGTGIKKHCVTHLLQVIPNPAKENIHVTVERKSIVRLYSNTGILVYETVATDSKVQIATNNLTPGLYIIEADSSGTVFRSKVVIQ